MTPHLPNDDQSGVYPKTYRQGDAVVPFQTGIEGADRIDEVQPSADCAVGIILMRLGIPKIDQEPIAE